MAVGSALTAAAAYAAASVHSLLWIGVFLFLGGMAAGGCNSAGGRWSRVGSRPSNAVWPWESARPHNLWASPPARW